MHPHPLRRARGRGASGRRATSAVLVVAGGLLLAGCAAGDETTQPAPPTSAGPAEPTQATSPSPQASQAPQTQDPVMTEQPEETQQPTGDDGAVLTEVDTGSSVTLAVGEERALRLGSAWSWSEPVVDGAAVTVTPVDYLVDPGYVEWLLTGAGEGAVVLEVVGEPVCGDTTVCPPTTVTLDVEVTG